MSTEFNAELIRATRQQCLDQVARELKAMRSEAETLKDVGDDLAGDEADMLKDAFEAFTKAAYRLGITIQEGIE